MQCDRHELDIHAVEGMIAERRQRDRAAGLRREPLIMGSSRAGSDGDGMTQLDNGGNFWFDQRCQNVFI